MNSALLDTDIYSEVLKAVDPRVTRNAIAYRIAHQRLTISALTVTEVVRGLRRVGASPGRLQAFRSAIAWEEILPLDPSSADLAGQIAGDLERVGQTIGLFDPMIAALAITHGLELVTGNTAHYQRLPPLGYPLTLVNWRL